MNEVTIAENAWREPKVESCIGTLVDRMKQSGEPLRIRRDGEDVAVLVNHDEYEAIQFRLKLHEDIRRAETQIFEGLSLSNEDAKAKALSRIRK